MKKITFDPELNLKHRILALFTFNNKALVVLLLNLYVKILSFFNLRNKSKVFNIKKINDKHYEVKTEAGIFHTPTVYRTLNLSSGLEWRTNLLAKSYGISYFKTVFSKKNPVVIDIGANIGEFSMYCVKKNSKVYSVEHDKVVFPMLKLNVEKFFPNIVPFNMSISNNTGKQNLYYATLTGSTTIVEPIKTDDYEKIELENFSSENKCDAEGAEPEIIKGLRKNSDRIGYITIDTIGERNGEDTTDEVVELLKERNFEIIKIPDEQMGRVVIAKNKNYY